MRTELVGRPLIRSEQQTRGPQVMEVIGPAGAGKSTVCQALAAANESIHLRNFPDVRNLTNAPFFLRYGLQTAMSFGRLPARESRRPNRQEIAWLSILHGWPKLLQSQDKSNCRVCVLDQGPIYLLSELRESGPTYLKRQSADKAWQRLYAGWASVLDTVIYLDAPDAVLAERIRARGKAHIMKEEADDMVFKFIHGFRSSYECVLSALRVYNTALRILTFDTSRATSDEIADTVVNVFGLAV